MAPVQSFPPQVCVSWYIEPVDMGFSGGASGKEFACQCQSREAQVQCLGREDPLEEGMAARSRVLAWRISWTEEPGGLQSTGSQRFGHD